MDKNKVSGTYLVVSEEKTNSFYTMYFSVSCAFFASRLFKGTEKNNENLSELQNKMFHGGVQLLGLLACNAKNRELLQNFETARKEIEELKTQRHEDAKANEKVVGIFASQEQNWLSEKKMLRLQIKALMNELRVTDKKKRDEISGLQEKVTEMELLVQSKDAALETEEQKIQILEERLSHIENTALDNSTALQKQKTAFIELVSSQRQLEADLCRKHKTTEAKKQELEASVLIVQKLSEEIMKMRADSEQKDKILSAIFRKSKVDIAEKHKWRAVMAPKQERQSLRSMLTSQPKSKLVRADQAIEYWDLNNDTELCSPMFEELGITAYLMRLEGWVRSEAMKYAAAIEKRHHLELDAFADEIRLKDEKLETSRRNLCSMELELKRLESYIKGINHDMQQLRQDNLRLKALVSEREQESNSYGTQLKRLASRKTNTHDPALTIDSIWSKVKISKRESLENKQEKKTSPTRMHEEQKYEKDKKTMFPEDSKERSCEMQDKTSSLDEENIGKETEDTSPSKSHSTKELEWSNHDLTKTSNSGWRMDLHALGVSYKIKRLKQQLLMLERLTENNELDKIGDSGKNAFLLLLTLLNKQVSRYQSLQGKTDDLGKRMYDDDLINSKGASKRTMENFLEETFQLQRYIVATGQKVMEIQSNITSGFVGVGLAKELDQSSTFDMKRFTESFRGLFHEVQRGLEVRIARIIGDLEGTLACQGIICSSR